MRAQASDRQDLLVFKAARDWLDQGRAEGRVEGERAALLVMLEERFGPVPDAVRERVSLASPQRIGLWVERVLDSTSLAEVLGEEDE